MKYTVTLQATASRNEEIEAETPEEAVEIAKRRSLTATVGLVAYAVENELAFWDVLGRCFSCAKLVLAENGERKGVVEASDEDGDTEVFHQDCYERAAAEDAAEGKPQCSS